MIMYLTENVVWCTATLNVPEPVISVHLHANESASVTPPILPTLKFALSWL